MDSSRRVWTLLAVLLLAGCAGVKTQLTEPAPRPAEPPEQGISAELPAAEPLAMQGAVTEPVTRGEGAQAVPIAPISGNRAVIALLDRAHQDAGAGRPEAAGASLERALRIEPRNPWLWHELAQLRLAQGQYAQAVSLAQKSNSFSRRDRHLQALNWRLIGQARVAQGNPAAGRAALQRAEELEN